MAKKAETKLLQLQLKQLLKEKDWELKEFALKLACSEENRSRDETDPNKEYEKLRKVLNRDSTKPEVLHRYINFVIEETSQEKLYKLPEIDLSNFNEVEQDLLKEVGLIAFNFFQSSSDKEIA